ncbi:hypothetical protein [Hoylesella buccalis]|uniref:hypothetical protein n=1 Tax=Hoylesella buccalis TaxID=28127 RepID=UPI002889FAAB|nr:hypothetical protein [Hoylesella buccalis]
MKAYLKLELNFFEAPVYMEMRAIEGCTGEGCVLALMRYLRTCPKGTGYLAALKNIAHDCRKSKTYLMHIISDYKIFEIVDQKFFFCPYLEHSLFVQHSTNNQFTPSQVLDNQYSPLYTNNTDNTNNTDDTNNPTTEKKRADAADGNFKNKNRETIPARQTCQSESQPAPQQEVQPAPQQEEQLAAQPMSQSASQTPGSKRAGKSMLVDAQSLTDKRPNHMTLAANEHAIAGHASAADVEAVEKGILNALFGDAAFMRSLEALTGLCVYRNAHTRYYCLQWFRMLRHSQGKPIKDISDAKCHLLALLRKGRKTRESFHRWHNDQLDPSRSSMIT